MILRTSAAAAACGIHKTTLWRLTITDDRVRACMFKRGYYIMEKLAALGLVKNQMGGAA